VDCLFAASQYSSGHVRNRPVQRRVEALVPHLFRDNVVPCIPRAPRLQADVRRWVVRVPWELGRVARQFRGVRELVQQDHHGDRDNVMFPAE
jgi:hypothetical protein